MCVTCLSRSVFEVPDTFKVKETDKERIRNMENEIEKGRGELSRRQKSREREARSGRNRTQRKSKQSDRAKQGEKSKSLRLRGTSPSIIVN